MNNHSITNIMDNIILQIDNYTEEVLFDHTDIINEYIDSINYTINNDVNNVANDIQTELTSCKRCYQKKIITIDGHYTCSNCGSIQATKLELGKGLFEQNNGYTLMSTSLMPAINNGSYGYTKMNMYGNFDMSKDERNIYDAFKIIHEICVNAKFTKKIEDTAKINYVNLKRCRNLPNKGKYEHKREKKKYTLIIKCIWESCLANGNLHNSKDFAILCKIDQKELTKGNKIYAKLTKGTTDEFKPKRILPVDYIHALCNTLMIDKIYEDEACKIANNITKLNICSNCVPPTVAPSVVFVIIKKYDLPINIKMLAGHSAASIATINKCYSKIAPYVDILVDDNKTSTIAKKLDDIIKKCKVPTRFLNIVAELQNIH